MAYVKLDCGMLDSTLWIDRAARELFITALLMAQPYEAAEPMEAIAVRELTYTGFVVPPGWYGFVEAAGTGIIHRAGMEQDKGLIALERLGEPESESRTPDFEGRRMVRVDGGYVILNFDKYRNKDHTAAERSKRYRERKALQNSAPSRVTSRSSRVASRSVTQAKAEVQVPIHSPSPESGERVRNGTGFAEFWAAYPRKKSKGEAERAWKKPHPSLEVILAAIAKAKLSDDWQRDGGRFIPYPASWLNDKGWEDEPAKRKEMKLW